MSERWLQEHQAKGLKLLHKVKETIHEERTPFQKLEILELEQYGKALVLDDVVQTTIKDEFVYHEMITHVPLCTHKSPSSILIIGGGDGGAVRECLKHEKVSSITLVEIDERVTVNCKEYLNEIACKLDDRRVKKVFDDGIRFVRNHQDEFDVILVDSPDPVGPAGSLYVESFYKDIYKCLKNDGILVAQTESPWLNSELLFNVTGFMCDLFPIVKTYYACIPTYQGGMWSFTLASKKYDPLDLHCDEPIKDTRYYNQGLHKSVFELPTFLRETVRNK